MHILSFSVRADQLEELTFLNILSRYIAVASCPNNRIPGVSKFLSEHNTLPTRSSIRRLIYLKHIYLTKNILPTALRIKISINQALVIYLFSITFLVKENIV